MIQQHCPFHFNTATTMARNARGCEKRLPLFVAMGGRKAFDLPKRPLHARKWVKSLGLESFFVLVGSCAYSSKYFV